MGKFSITLCHDDHGSDNDGVSDDGCVSDNDGGVSDDDGGVSDDVGVC